MIALIAPFLMASTSPTESPPVEVALTCVVFNPQAETKSLIVELDEHDNGGIHVEYSITGNEVLTAAKIVRSKIETSDGRTYREFIIEDARGPLTMRLINRGSEWAVDLAPASWTVAYGPLVSGRCSINQRKPNRLVPFADPSAIQVNSSALDAVDISNDWSGAVAKTCYLTNGLRTEHTPFSVADNGDLTFEDIRGTVKGAVVFSRGSMSALHKRFPKNLPGGDEKVLSIFYRQGRFWVDVTRSQRDLSLNWIRGVCVEHGPESQS